MTETEKVLTTQFYALNSAQTYAENNSTCAKVKVGSLIITPNKSVIPGCNHGVNNCVINGCRRIKLYGEASKEHRLPSDCDALHSEIDAICKAAKAGAELNGATIFVTRYPCEACARAIAESGIKEVVYGRKQEISDYTKEILKSSGVNFTHAKFWHWEDNNA